jgi:3-phenylpropionate/trans-cinnamate dioxygenase ferredoxin subunit
VAFRRVARVNEVPPGKTLYLCVDSEPLVLARVRAEVFALRGICPHKENPLQGATLLGYLLDCPWHHFQYDVRSGENHFPANVYPADIPKLAAQVKPIRVYAVEVRGEEIWVDLP